MPSSESQRQLHESRLGQIEIVIVLYLLAWRRSQEGWQPNHIIRLPGVIGFIRWCWQKTRSKVFGHSLSRIERAKIRDRANQYLKFSCEMLQSLVDSGFDNFTVADVENRDWPDAQTWIPFSLKSPAYMTSTLQKEAKLGIDAQKEIDEIYSLLRDAKHKVTLQDIITGKLP